MSTYAFSVVTAVYNAEPFLPDTVRSLLKQSFDFSRVQLILVDDGSTDGSGAMCDAFRKAHPDNIVVVHQANGGVSAARNEGLRHVQGRYVSFLDADDMLSKNALSCVYRFFEAHPETDVVSLPMRFFDGSDGEHILNYKYENGTRVIDLEAEPCNPQLAVTSAFVRADALEGKRFDTRLKYAEDAKLLQSILIEKRKLGVVADALHRYRRRTRGEASAIQQSESSPAWYTPYLTHFCEETFDLCMQRFGKIPRFVQATVAYDLQWRIRQGRIPSAVLDAQAQEAYRAQLFSIYRRIDDDLIVAQRSMPPFQKAFVLRQKHGTAPTPVASERGRLFRFGEGEPFDLGFDKVNCDFFRAENGMATLECNTVMTLGLDENPPELVAEANGTQVFCEPLDRHSILHSVNEPIAARFEYIFRIPLPDRKTPLRIRILRRTANGCVPVDQLSFGRFFPITEQYRNAYARIGDRALTYSDGVLCYGKLPQPRFVREVRYWKELWCVGRREERHAMLGRLLYALAKPFVRKPIWIISDRAAAAGDNGEALFRYLRAQNPKDLSLWFAVSQKSPAFAELRSIGRVVDSKSYKHKLLYLLSEMNISSHADSDIVTLFSGYNAPYRDIENRIHFVFLQHGVTNNDMSDWLNRYNCNIDGLVTVSTREADSFRTGAYFYPDSAIWLTGFPRYDRLYHDEKRCITIMPTWRRALSLMADPKTGERKLREGFEQSEFYRFYQGLLTDRRLLDAAKTYGYTVRFLPHPTLQPHIGRFETDGSVELLSASTPYRKVFAESDLIVTDYSSVAFDFAYLRKPVIYAQFDRESFYSGEHVYVRGYFEHERDGFGEVETDLAATVDRLIEYMQNGCRLKDKYRARIDSFFAFDDSDNCRRVYEKLRELQKE